MGSMVPSGSTQVIEPNEPIEPIEPIEPNEPIEPSLPNNRPPLDV
jgi:hypothetical protein